MSGWPQTYSDCNRFLLLDAHTSRLCKHPRTQLAQTTATIFNPPQHLCETARLILPQSMVSLWLSMSQSHWAVVSARFVTGLSAVYKLTSLQIYSQFHLHHSCELLAVVATLQQGVVLTRSCLLPSMSTLAVATSCAVITLATARGRHLQLHTTITMWAALRQ